MIFITEKHLNRIMGNSILIHPGTRLATRGLALKYIACISFFLFCTGVMADAPLASKQQIGMFKNSRTCVVFEDGFNLKDFNHIR
jgi:hypothetical protein